VLLYLMLTDELPFLATSALDLAVQIAGSDPEPPNRRVADLDPGLVAVCLKGLRREAKQRYADAGAFADDLQAVLAGNTPAALKARSAPAGTLVAFAGLLVVIGAGAMLAQGDAPSRGRADTVGERERESSTPSNQDEPLDRVELSSADAAAQLRKVLGISNPRTKLQAAWTLLRSRPPELQRTRALSLVQRLGREHPLLVLAHGERTEKPRDVVIADFVGNELISWRWEDVRRWRLPNGTGRAVPAPTAIRDLVTSGGDALICAHTDGVFRVTRLADAKALSVPGLERIKTIRSLVYTQQGQALALLSEGPAPLVIDLKLSVVRRLDSDYGAPLSIAFSPDGERLVSLHGVLDMIGIREGTAVLWDISGPSVLATQPTPVGCIRVTYSRDGKRIVFGSSSGHLLLYDDELKPQGRFETQGTSAGNILQGLGHSGHIRGLAFSKSGRRLFTCGKGNLGVGHELRCWDAESRELVWEALNRKRLPDSLAVSADGAYLAVGTSNAAVEVWIADPEAGL
jgi:sugar lactone lactonase YvrE